MYNLPARNRFQKWEYENQLYLLRARAGVIRLFSFAAYLLWVVARGLFVGPELVRRVCPNSRSLQRHEFEKLENREYRQRWIN